MYVNEVLANRFGINVAVILQTLAFWINYNRKHEKNYYDGKTWTYMSLEEMCNRLNILSVDKIRYALEKLIKQGIVTKNNYNKTKYDRTSWYSFLDETLLQEIIRLCNFSQMEAVKSTNGIVEIPEPIPEVKKDINIQEASETIIDNSNNEIQNQIIQVMKDAKLSEKQINYALKNYKMEYLRDKIDQYLYLLTYDAKKIKNKSKYLYNSIHDNWKDDLYSAHIEAIKRRKEKEKSENDIKNHEKSRQDYEKFIESECMNEYKNLSEDDKKEIDTQIDEEIQKNPIIKNKKELIPVTKEIMRVTAVYERVRDKIKTFEEFIK